MPKQNRTYTPEQQAEYRKKKQEEISALTKRIDEGVKQVFESKRFKDYLEFCSSFTNYSMRNTMLIAMQKPNATFVASFKKWQELERSVDKGQKGIQILAPVQVKTGDYIESEREVTDDLGIKQYNDDGTVKTEVVAEPLKKLAFKQVYVFDVSQTSGKPLPTLMDELDGNLDEEHKRAMLSGIQKAVKIPVEFEDITTEAKGYFDFQSQRIVINNGMSDVQTIKTALHEAAHKLLHDRKQNLPTAQLSKNDKEIQAEATAFIVANKYGIDTSEYTFPYIAAWSQGKELTQLKNYLDEIQNAARELCKNIDNELIKLKATRELSNGEITNAPEEVNIQETAVQNKDMNFVDKMPIPPTQEPDEYVDYPQANLYEPPADYYANEPVPPPPMEYPNEPPADYYANEPVPPPLTEYSNEPPADYYANEPVPPPPMEYPNEPPADYYANEPFSPPSPEYSNEPPVSPAKKPQRENKATENTPQTKTDSGQPVKTSSNIIGNTPYNQLGNKSDLKYFHASPEMTDKIAEKLNAEGIRFSGLKRTSGTTFTVNKSDTEKYSNAVAEVNAQKEVDLKKQTFKPKNPAVIGNAAYTQLDNGKKFSFTAQTADKIIKEIETMGLKYAGYKKEDKVILAVSEKDVPRLQGAFNKIKDLQNLAACHNYIAENINKAFESRSVKEFCNTLEEKFGVEAAAKVVGKNIAVHKDSYPPKMAENSQQFKYSRNDGIALLDNIQPSMISSLYNDLSVRKKVLDKEKEPPQLKLNSYFKDKHLLPHTRIYLDKDKNGFPITKHENTSANEYYVQGYGWLDNEALEKARREYPNPALFGQLITKANVNYVDDNGQVGQADIDYMEYSAFTDITYSKENAERYEAAKEKMNKRTSGATSIEMPTEYYAVSRISENRYNIVTIGTDGTPDIVKKGLTKEAAAQALEDIFYTKNNEQTNCEIISQADLQEMCNQKYREQLETVKKLEGENYKERDVSFTDIKLSILPNPNKEASDNLSHFVQAYVKDGDRYKATGVAMVGTYDECRAFTDKAKAVEKLPVPACSIYQMKAGEENHGIRFAGTKELAGMGIKPDFNRYEKVYELPVSELPKQKNVPAMLENLYQKFNVDPPKDFKGHSLSVSDVVVLDKNPYFVDSVGFKKINNFLPEQRIESQQKAFMENFAKAVSAVQSPDDLTKIRTEAEKLGIDCEIEWDKAGLQKTSDINPIQPQKQVKKGGHSI